MPKDLSSLPWWAIFVIAIVALLVSTTGLKSILDFVRWLLERQRHPSDMQAVLRASSRINAEISRVREVTGADQVLVLRAHNGGKIPRVGARLKSSVTHESWGPNRDSIMDTWQSQPLDASYVDMLVEVAEHGHITNVTEDMPPSVLRDAYQAMRIVRSRVVDLGSLQEGLYYYMSLTWTEHATPSGDATIANACRIAKTRISRELERTRGSR